MARDMSFICDKCGIAINTGTKCLNCGYDNKDIKMPSQRFLNKALVSAYRSTRLTVFMILFIVLDVFLIFLSLSIFSNHEIQQEFKILVAVSIGLMVLDIALCIFIFSAKRWAFNVYIGLNIINCVLRV